MRRVLLVGAVLVSAAALVWLSRTDRVATTQPTLPADCSGVLTADEVEVIALAIHIGPDDDPALLVCTEAMSNETGALVFERLAEIEGFELPYQAPLEDVHPELVNDPGYDPDGQEP